MSDWQAVLAGASATRTLERARKAIGRKTKYELGKGGFDPTRESLDSSSDCSGFVAWAIGYPRELPPGSGKWLSTVEYWNGGGQTVPNAFTIVPTGEAQPGDLYVFPDHAGRQGHIGIISHVENGRPSRVIHCSAGNSRVGDAVLETLTDVFTSNERARVVRPNYSHLIALAGQPIRVREVIADVQSGRVRSGAVVERPADDVTPVLPTQGAFDLRNDEIERALHTGDHQGLLEDYFGAAEYQELIGLTRAARRSTVRGGPKVLLLHGIMGSKLGWDRFAMFDDVLWADPIDIARGRLEQLALPAQNERAREIKPLGVMLFTYLKLKLKLQVAGFDVDFFAYDWRKDIAESGRLLAERLKAEQNASIVAHSMGGLVARWAIKQQNAPFKRLIMLGTPNSGSFAPVMAIRATYGVVRKIGWLDRKETPESLSRQVFSTLPGLLQMLPFANVYETDLSQLEQWPNDDLRPQPAALLGVRQLQASLFEGEKENTFVIAGVRRDTAVGMRVLGNDMPQDQRVAYEFSPEGDGTVPLAFARLDNANMYYVEEDHGRLPNNSVVANACIDLLSRGSTSVLPSTYTPRRDPPRLVPEIELRRPAYDLRRDGRLSKREERELINEVAAPDSTPALITTTVTGGIQATSALVSTTGSYAHEFERVVVGRRRQHRLEIRFAQGSITETDTRAIAVGTFRDVIPSGAAAAINTRLHGAITEVMRRRMFGSDVGQVFILPTGRHPLIAELVAFVGLGAFDRLTDETIQIAAENVIRTFINTRVEEFSTVLFGAGSGVPIENALRSLLNGFIRGLCDADSDHLFRRVVICEQDPERYQHLKREIYRLASTQLCEDVEITFDEAVLPTPHLAEDGVRGIDRIGQPVYLQVTQETQDNGDFIVRTSLLTPGSKATVIAEETPVNKQEFERALRNVLDLQTAELQVPGTELARIVLGETVRTVLPRFAESHLMILHDAEMARVPWETIALPRPEGGLPWFPAAEKGITHKYVAENLSVAKWLEERINDGVLNVLMVVNPTGDLPGAEQECERVAALLASIPSCTVDVLRGEEATRPALLQAFSSGKYDVVHYAGHAFFDARHREKSGIKCAGGHVLSGADLVNLASLPSIVFFNACESAKLRRNRAIIEQLEESHAAVAKAVGFAEAFLRGGVATFIGTYWPVGDQEASVFAASFYETVLRAGSLNDAVQNGRAAVRQLGSRDWANYIVYGDPTFQLKA